MTLLSKSTIQCCGSRVHLLSCTALLVIPSMLHALLGDITRARLRLDPRVSSSRAESVSLGLERGSDPSFRFASRKGVVEHRFDPGVWLPDLVPPDPRFMERKYSIHHDKLQRESASLNLSLPRSRVGISSRVGTHCNLPPNGTLNRKLPIQYIFLRSSESRHYLYSDILCRSKCPCQAWCDLIRSICQNRRVLVYHLVTKGT
jgi:hypothetical protein